MQEVDAARESSENAEKMSWNPDRDAVFTRNNPEGVADRTPCGECVGLLQRCAGTTWDEQRAQAAKDGNGSPGGWMRLDITAEDFKCQATIRWGEPQIVSGEAENYPVRLTMPRLCFPAECSYDDIQKLFQYDIAGDVKTASGEEYEYQGESTCDIAATIIDDSAPWWFLVFGFFFVVANIALSSSGSPGFLRCMLWCYMAFDIGVGFALIVYGFLVLQQGSMPVFIKVSFPLFGLVQVAIGGLLSVVMDSGDSRGIKTGICACLAGKTWLLYVSNVLALLHGLTCLVVGIVYKVTGESSIESWVHELDDEEHTMS